MRGHCTTEDEPGTASYCMLVQPDQSLALFGILREDERVTGDHARAGIALMAGEAQYGPS